jgi:hypothetical protein
VRDTELMIRDPYVDDADADQGASSSNPGYETRYTPIESTLTIFVNVTLPHKVSMPLSLPMINTSAPRFANNPTVTTPTI